jgi:hypothetical protein
VAQAPCLKAILGVSNFILEAPNFICAAALHKKEESGNDGGGKPVIANEVKQSPARVCGGGAQLDEHVQPVAGVDQAGKPVFRHFPYRLAVLDDVHQVVDV